MECIIAHTVLDASELELLIIQTWHFIPTSTFEVKISIDSKNPSLICFQKRYWNAYKNDNSAADMIKDKQTIEKPNKTYN